MDIVRNPPPDDTMGARRRAAKDPALSLGGKPPAEDDAGTLE